MMHRNRLRLIAAAVLVLGTPNVSRASDDSADIQTVHFPSADGSTRLVGYLIEPQRHDKPTPAIVLMHGRSGAYSKAANGDYSAQTLRKRDIAWARAWRNHGYIVLLVDSFGPRGFPQGFGAGTHDERPASVDEVTVRPLDAYGALNWLRRRPDVAPDRVGLMGWSNGASATLATMARNGVGSAAHLKDGFRVAAAFYPGCGLNDAFADGYRPYAPVALFIGTADEEVSLQACQTLAARNARLGGGIAITVYPDATHDFDDPANHRQDNAANARARDDATHQTFALFDSRLRP